MQTHTNYPAHLSEPLRIRIATSYAQHELRKLLPGVRDAAAWQQIDAQVAQWHKMLLVRDFWNGVHGISIGFHLKSLVPWITSLNMRWEEKDVPVEELWFGQGFGLITSLGVPESAPAIKTAIAKPEQREWLMRTKEHLSAESGKTAPRDAFPLFMVRKEGKLRTVDGNRRLLQAIIAGTPALHAFVGEQTAEPALYEHWVPTSLLVELVFWNKRWSETGRDTTATVALLIAELIRDSSAGRQEFSERAIHRDDAVHMRLLRAVEKLL